MAPESLDGLVIHLLALVVAIGPLGHSQRRHTEPEQQVGALAVDVLVAAGASWAFAAVVARSTMHTIRADQGERPPEGSGSYHRQVLSLGLFRKREQATGSGGMGLSTPLHTRRGHGMLNMPNPLRSCGSL